MHQSHRRLGAEGHPGQRLPSPLFHPIFSGGSAAFLDCPRRPLGHWGLSWLGAQNSSPNCAQPTQAGGVHTVAWELPAGEF